MARFTREDLIAAVHDAFRASMTDDARRLLQAGSILFEPNWLIFDDDIFVDTLVQVMAPDDEIGGRE